MKPENKQFIFILICTVIVFFGLDLVFKWGRNALLKKRIDQVQLGMSESEAVRVVGRSPVIITNGVKEITLLDHDSIFDVVFLQKMTSVGQSIVIESGKVVSVDWTLINR